MITKILDKQIEFTYLDDFYDEMPLGESEVSQIMFQIYMGKTEGVTCDSINKNIPELDILGKWKLS